MEAFNEEASWLEGVQHVCIVPTLFTPRDLFRCGFRVISLFLPLFMLMMTTMNLPSCLLPFPSHAATVCHDQPMHRMRLRRQRRLPRVMLGRGRRKSQHESDESHNFVSLSCHSLPHSLLPSFAGVDYSFIRSLTLSLTESSFLSLSPFLPFIPLATMI